jgi:uncharacterized protein
MKIFKDRAHSDGLPALIPVFPLAGVLLLPRGELPLNIFEPRYLAMVDDALKADRLIGIIQPRLTETVPPGIDNSKLLALYTTGCAGRITAFSETGDGRYLITLTGLRRFRLGEELPMVNGYRRIQPEWFSESADNTPAQGLNLDRSALKRMLEDYFERNGLSCDWEVINDTPDERLITCLSMICPFDPEEKQALLEAACCQQRAERFMSLLRMALYESSGIGRH